MGLGTTIKQVWVEYGMRGVDGAQGAAQAEAGIERAAQKAVAAYAMIAAAGAGILAAMIVPAMALQDAIAAAASRTGLTGRALEDTEKRMSNLAVVMSAKFNESVGDIGETMRLVINAGISPMDKGFQNIVETVLKLKKVVGDVDVDVMAKTLIGLVNNFGYSYAQVGDVAGKLMVAEQSWLHDLPEIIEFMRKAAPIAGSVKMTLEGALALSGLLSQGMLRGTGAGTQVRTIIMRAFGQPQALSAMKGIGVSPWTKEGAMRPMNEIFQDLAQVFSKMNTEERTKALYSIFKIRGSEAAQVLINMPASQWDKYSKDLDKLNKSGAKQLDQAFFARMNTFSEQLGRVFKGLTGIFGLLGMNNLARITGDTTGLADAIERLLKRMENHKIIVNFAGSIAIFSGEVLLLTGTIGLAIKLFPKLIGWFGLTAAAADGAAVASTTAIGAMTIGLVALAAEVSVVLGLYYLLSDVIESIHDPKANTLTNDIWETLVDLGVIDEKYSAYPERYGLHSKPTATSLGLNIPPPTLSEKWKQSQESELNGAKATVNINGNFTIDERSKAELKQLGLNILHRKFDTNGEVVPVAPVSVKQSP